MEGPKKLTELIKNGGKFSYSFEVTPDVSEEDIDNLKVEPVFFSVTWHAKIHRCKDLNIDPLMTASLIKSKNKHVLLHLSCDLMRTSYLSKVLAWLKENDICNLFLVLGEDYNPKDSDFQSTSEMIKFIREKTGRYFCIGIAGFPGCSDDKLLQLKDKIDDGADFIMTQAFFNVEAFQDLRDRCDKMKINVPIIPGVFPFESPQQLTSFLKLCKIKVSDDLLEAVTNEDRMNMPCTDIVKKLIQELISKCQTTHFHFFTINKLQTVQNVIEAINELCL